MLNKCSKNVSVNTLHHNHDTWLPNNAHVCLFLSDEQNITINDSKVKLTDTPPPFPIPTAIPVYK